jgi:hypothetical protein
MVGYLGRRISETIEQRCMRDIADWISFPRATFSLLEKFVEIQGIGCCFQLVRASEIRKWLRIVPVFFPSGPGDSQTFAYRVPLNA